MALRDAATGSRSRSPRSASSSTAARPTCAVSAMPRSTNSSTTAGALPGSIGRLSLGVFGSTDPAAAAPLADALGVALQLTNILRDIREDLGNGRVYLPADDVARFGCTLIPAGPDGEGGDGKIDGPMAELIRFEADRARQWYATACS